MDRMSPPFPLPEVLPLDNHPLLGLEQVGLTKYRRRLGVCEACPNREGPFCRFGRKHLAWLARWEDNECPQGRWVIPGGGVIQDGNSTEE